MLLDQSQELHNVVPINGPRLRQEKLGGLGQVVVATGCHRRRSCSVLVFAIGGDALASFFLFFYCVPTVDSLLSRCSTRTLKQAQCTSC